MEKVSSAVLHLLLWSVIQDYYIWNSICTAELDIDPVVCSPSFQAADRGESVFVHCVSGDSRPLVEIRLSKDRRTVSEELEFQGQYSHKNPFKASAEEHIANVSEEDNRNCSSVTYNPILNVTTHSNPATLKVKALTPKLHIIKSPEDITVASGKTASVHCAIQGFHWSNVTWFKNNKPLNGIMKYDDSQHILMLRNMSFEDEGFYHCEENIRNEIVTSQAAYLLPAGHQMLLIPRVNLTDEGLYNCVASSTLGQDERTGRLKVHAHILLCLSVLYFLLFPHFVLQCCSIFLTFPFLFLCIPSLTVCAQCLQALCIISFTFLSSSSFGSHSPITSCIFYSGFPSSAALATVPPSILFLNASTQVRHGLEFTLFCDVSGIPKPNVFWFFKNRPLIASNQPNFLTENGILKIRKAMQSFEGIYECEAVNEAGSAKRSVAVYIDAPVQDQLTDDCSLAASDISAPTSLAPEEHTVHSDILTAIVCPSVSVKSKHLLHSHSQSSRGIKLLPVTASSIISLDSQSSVPAVFVTLNIAVTSAVKPFPSATMLTVRPSSPSALAVETSFRSSEMSTGKLFPFQTVSTVKPFQSWVISAVKPFSSSAPVAKRSLPSPVASTMKSLLSPSMSSVRPLSPQTLRTIPTISTMNAFPTLTPLALGSPSLDIPVLTQYSTPVEVALNLTDVSSTVGGTALTSNVNSSLEISRSTNPGKATTFTQEQLPLLTRNSTLPSLRTYLHYLSKDTAKYSSEPAWNSNCTTSQPFHSSPATIGTSKRGGTTPKESSTYFALEKHDIPVVVGVTISLTMIFSTMCVYSVRQKKNESKETQRHLLCNSRMSCQNRDRFEMQTHENRAFEEDDPNHAVEQTTHERPSDIASSPKQSSIKAITVTAEFALVSQSENFFSISRNNHLQASNKDSSKGDKQKEAKFTIPSRSRSSLSHHEDIVKEPNTWKQSAIFQEKLLTSLLMLELNRNPFTEERQKIESLTRSNSIPCCAKKASWRKEQALFNASSHSDKVQGTSYFSLQPIGKQPMDPGMGQLHTEPTSSDLSENLSGAARMSTGIESVTTDVLVYSQLPAASSLPTLVPSTASVQLISVPHKQLDGLDCE
ncbi:uncharacterized protein [Chiloscyllium punctatum]|uniref:uncharacterized protein n=1 Tax=Chiloscyllium punctatum TaxID=137246 RepID=UPI003B632F17